MYILGLNVGSSSIKALLYCKAAHRTVLSVHLQWKQGESSFDLILSSNEKEEKITGQNAEGMQGALGSIMDHILSHSPLKSFDEITLVGHRMVHGGRAFPKSVKVTPDVKQKLSSLIPLAPLHTPLEIEAIDYMQRLCPKASAIAVFDTSFHRSLKEAAKVYPGPYSWYEEGVERYGFHGISYQYCSKRAAQMMGRDLSSLKMLVCHLGSGASLCAIDQGKSVDTTMGMTPLDGLMMATRSGSIDPGIISYLVKQKQLSVEKISEILYESSGLLGLSGVSSDMKEVIEKAQEGHERSKLALDVYLHRLGSCMGSMIVSLGGLDVLVFTGGIGEKSALIRKKACLMLRFLGLELDANLNAKEHRKDVDLSAESSSAEILLIHTQEELEIIYECTKLL